MKHSYIVIILLVTLSACKVKYKYPPFDFNNGPNPCINAFKDRVFISILEECYKGTDAFKEMNKVDVGNPYDGIYSPTLFEKIDSIGKDFARKIPPPVLCECTKEQNYFMAQALHFYRSKELDSITRAELKKFSGNCLKW